ncbi:sal-like protein 2 [Eublepharis macularius]|uniref:Sal-like protein 2 n=1 Tax=Eublepharis macularius TaxID=481883 RepID=A0AA97LCX2_EUBMA|nr:sal-like protein 2 [Eublepharis macularius]
MSRRKQRNPQQLISDCEGSTASENGALRGARERSAAPSPPCLSARRRRRPPDARGPCCSRVGAALGSRSLARPLPPPSSGSGGRAAGMSSPRGRGQEAEDEAMGERAGGDWGLARPRSRFAQGPPRGGEGRAAAGLEPAGPPAPALGVHSSTRGGGTVCFVSQSALCAPDGSGGPGCSSPALPIVPAVQMHEMPLFEVEFGDTGDESAPLSCPSCHIGLKDPLELSAHVESCCPEQPTCSSATSATAAGQETTSSSSSSSSSSSVEVRPESPPSMDVESGPLSTDPSQEPAPPPPLPPPPPPPPPPTTIPTGHLNIPLILEELRVLQQRQLHQMQMTEQICRQVLLLGSLGQVGSPAPSAEPAPGATLPPKPPLPVFSIKTEPGRTPSSGSPEVPKPAFFHLYHPFPGGTRVPKAEQLLAPAFPTATGLLAAQCLGAARGLEQATSPGLLRQKNGSSGEASLEEKPGGRHKCRFCGKVFGSDSALQIHLRSHTGERPYKCNICGNRFTTRGNLKVHFHRHREKYPHVQMNPHPVPEHLDYVLTTSGLPYGMSVPPEKAEPGEESAVPPAVTERKALSATESLTLLSGASPSAAAQALPSFNKLVLMKAVEAKGKGDENTPPERETEGARLQLGKLVGSLPSWALLANHFKAGTAVGPFPYVLEASPSETSKLQQLVEKIDRQGSPSSGATPVAATQAVACSSSSSSLPATSGSNQCVICLRVLSCPRALQLHYGQHGGERPFKCKVCGRAFSTRGNLRAHFVGHKTSSAARPQNSCPICQKKFTNAVSLQQHVRMHLGGQIPNGALLPEPSTAEGAMTGEGEKQQQQPLQPAPPQDGELTEEDEEEATDEDSLESGIEKAEGPSSPEQEAPCLAKEGEEAGPAEEEEGGTGAASPLGARSPQRPTQEGEEKAEMEVEEGGTLQEEEEEEQGKEKGTAGEGPSEKPQGIQAKEGPSLACGICKQVFPDRAALRKHALTAHHQVNMSSPAWISNPARHGQRLSLEGPVPVLSGGQVKLQDFLGRDIPAQLVGVGPLSFWNQYTAFLSGGLPAKPAHGSAASGSSSASSSTSNMAAQGLFGNMPGKAVPGEAKEKPAMGSLLLLPPPPAPAPEVLPESQGKGEK